jgi:DNA-binding transcriptional regulator LsrR (DeoR family)
VVVADTGDLTDGPGLLPALGSAAAGYLETTLTGGDRIGISSWSSTLLATVEAMHPRPGRVAENVAQVLGGVGQVTAQTHATRLTGRLAQLTGATASYLSAPGLAATRDALVADPHIAAVLRATETLSLLLVGIGSLAPSRLLRESGNAMTSKDEAELVRLGAVGDVCLRYFDEQGRHLTGELDRRVIGITAAALRAVPRRVGVAGGESKYVAIRAAVRGDWVNVLVTDPYVAQRLVGELV